MTKRFFDSVKRPRATRHPSQLNGRNYRVMHILRRRTPPPPKLNLPLINFGFIYSLWISPHPPSRGQWYHGLIELEVTFLKILHKFPPSRFSNSACVFIDQFIRLYTVFAPREGIYTIQYIQCTQLYYTVQIWCYVYFWSMRLLFAKRLQMIVNS